MVKLRLKRTPAEEQERARRKAYKAAKRAAKRIRSGGAHGSDSPHGSSSTNKKQRTRVLPDAVISDDDMDGPPASSHKLYHDAIRAELEDIRFREKMWDALEDDERLDGINARFNDYAHVPDRWTRDKRDSVNPQYMDDNEYAEWVREGMWKKKHAREYEEQAKRDAEKASQRAREKEIRAETIRLERLALEQEERRRKERKRWREEEHRQKYEEQWKALLDPRSRDHGPLTFGDIPWPLFSAHITKSKGSSDALLHTEEITPEAIATFLFPEADNMAATSKDDGFSRRNRDRLKETLLRFHPDKFEGRFMCRVPASDIENVRKAIGQVVRALNVLMNV